VSVSADHGDALCTARERQESSILEQHDAGGEQERAVRTLQLAAETGVTIFRVGFEKWIARSAGTLARCIQETLDELKTLTTGV